MARRRKEGYSKYNFRLMRVKEGEGVLLPQEQTLYRYGVGILLYLVKQTRPDLANATRELSRVNTIVMVDMVDRFMYMR